MNLNWIVNENATVWHIASVMARSLAVSDPRLGHAAADLAAKLHDEISRTGDANGAWSTICAHACQYDEIGLTVRAGLPAIEEVESRDGLDRIIRLATEFSEEVHRALPGFGDDLRHRIRPLREQWEARGPGLLRRLRHVMKMDEADGQDWLGGASVFVVHPVLGGGGGVDPTRSALWMEALLANTVPGLPEVVRLGWMLGQLASHATAASSTRAKDRGTERQLVELALVPATLAAAETVELAICNRESVTNAIVAWQLAAINAHSSEVENTAKRVWQWWETRNGWPNWNRALVDLGDCLA